MRNVLFRAIVLISAMVVSSASMAAGNEKIVIGTSLPLSGVVSLQGHAKLDGYNAYFARVNRDGGINGRQIDLQVMDDAYAGDRVTANVKAIGSNPDSIAILGLLGAPTVAIAMPLVTAMRLPAVGLTTGTAALRTPYNRYVFPIRAGFGDEARYIVQQLSTLNLKRVVIVQQDTTLGKAVAEVFSATIAKNGLQQVALIVIDATGKNAADVAAKVQQADPNAVFYAGLVASAIPLIKALRHANISASIFSMSSVDAISLGKALGPEARGVGITQIVPIPHGVGSPIVREYLAALKEAGETNPHFYGLEAFIEAKVLVEALKRAGKNPTRESLVRALESLQDYDVGGLSVTYDSQIHRGSQFVELTVMNASGGLLK